MNTNLATDLRRLAKANDHAAAQATAPARPTTEPRMTELQRIFRRLETVGATARH